MLLPKFDNCHVLLQKIDEFCPKLCTYLGQNRKPCFVLYITSEWNVGSIVHELVDSKQKRHVLISATLVSREFYKGCLDLLGDHLQLLLLLDQLVLQLVNLAEATVRRNDKKVSSPLFAAWQQIFQQIQLFRQSSCPITNFWLHTLPPSLIAPTFRQTFCEYHLL